MTQNGKAAHLIVNHLGRNFSPEIVVFGFKLSTVSGPTIALAIMSPSSV